MQSGGIIATARLCLCTLPRPSNLRPCCPLPLTLACADFPAPGNGQSDRPKLFVRSRWWTIDDLVEKDVPAVLSYVRRVTGADQVHVVSQPGAVLGKGSGGLG